MISKITSAVNAVRGRRPGGSIRAGRADTSQAPSRLTIAADGIVLRETAIPKRYHARFPGNAYLIFGCREQISRKFQDEIPLFHGNSEDLALAMGANDKMPAACQRMSGHKRTARRAWRGGEEMQRIEIGAHRRRKSIISAGTRRPDAFRATRRKPLDMEESDTRRRLVPVRLCHQGDAILGMVAFRPAARRGCAGSHQKGPAVSAKGTHEPFHSFRRDRNGTQKQYAIVRQAARERRGQGGRRRHGQVHPFHFGAENAAQGMNRKRFRIHDYLPRGQSRCGLTFPFKSVARALRGHPIEIRNDQVFTT